jgi:hypothetical protein
MDLSPDLSWLIGHPDISCPLLVQIHFKPMAGPRCASSVLRAIGWNLGPVELCLRCCFSGFQNFISPINDFTNSVMFQASALGSVAIQCPFMVLSHLPKGSWFGAMKSDVAIFELGGRRRYYFPICHQCCFVSIGLYLFLPVKSGCFDFVLPGGVGCGSHEIRCFPASVN